MAETKYKQTEVGLIPEEWEKKLGDVAKIIRGVRVTKNNLLSYGPYPVVSGGIGYMGYMNEYNREPETITIAQYGSAGYVNWQTQKFWANDVCFSVIPNVESILNKFLYYTLANKQEYLYSISNRDATPFSIEKNKILQTTILIPPLTEQHAIASALTSMDNLIASLDKLIAKTQSVKEGAMQQFLTNLSDGKVVYCTIGDVCEISRGVVISKDYIRRNLGEYPVYSSQTENKGVLGRISTYMYDGEFLTWTTDGENAGSVFYRNGRFNITNVCGLLKVKDNNSLSAKYLSYILHKTAKSYVNRDVGNPKLMSNIMATVEIPIPPIKTQHRIASTLTAIDDQISALEAKRKKYEMVKVGMMQQLLTGKIRLK